MSLPRSASSADRTEADPLRPVPTVFLLAHPDDDALIAGTMRRLIEVGAEVHGIWACAGEHDEARKWMRWGEGQRAMKHLGLAPERMHFMDFPFLKMLPVLESCADRLAHLLREIRPHQMFVVGFEGGHVDHDAVNFLAYEALHLAGLDIPLYEFPLYNGSGPIYGYRLRINAFPNHETPTRYMPLTREALRRKLEALVHYHSQRRFMWTYRAIAFFRRHASRGEPYRLCPPTRDHAIPPHPGRLNLERWFNRYMQVTFADFQAAVTRARRRQK